MAQATKTDCSTVKKKETLDNKCGFYAATFFVFFSAHGT